MLIKSRPSPDARRASANACPKTVIQAHQDYTLTIWTGRNAALHANTQDTELVVHAQLNAGIRRLYKLNDSFADSAKQYFRLPLDKNPVATSPEIDNDDFSLPAWLQLVPVVVARDSTFSPPSLHIHRPPTKPVELHHQWLVCLLFSNNFHSDRYYFPKEPPQFTAICRFSLPSV